MKKEADNFSISISLKRVMPIRQDSNLLGTRIRCQDKAQVWQMYPNPKIAETCFHLLKNGKYHSNPTPRHMFCHCLSSKKIIELIEL